MDFLQWQTDIWQSELIEKSEKANELHSKDKVTQT